MTSSSMRVIEIAKAGGPEMLVVATRPRPTPADDEVLIRVAAAGVNRPDVAQRQGIYPPPPGATDIPGLEIAGRIEETGSAVTAWRPGDEVCALVTGGGYAEYCVAPAAQCLPIPQGLSAIEAASLPETFFTVWSNVFERGQLAPGESLLVQGGTSGIGVTAIQLAKAFGSTVFATAGSDEKCDACRWLGADLAINYRSEDFADAVKQATQGKGVDVILDMVGGSDYLRREVACAANDGRIVLIALLGGTEGRFDISQLLRKRLTITGSTLRARPVAFKAAIANALHERVWPLFGEGKIRPFVDRTFSLPEVAKAHALMESSAHIGKIVLSVS